MKKIFNFFKVKLLSFVKFFYIEDYGFCNESKYEFNNKDKLIKMYVFLN